MRRKRFVLLHLYGAACVCCYFRELLRGSTSRHCCKKKRSIGVNGVVATLSLYGSDLTNWNFWLNCSFNMSACSKCTDTWRQTQLNFTHIVHTQIILITYTFIFLPHFLPLLIGCLLELDSSNSNTVVQSNPSSDLWGDFSSSAR